MGKDRESLDVDVLFVGAGPACLAGALHLSRLIKRHDLLVQNGAAQGRQIGEVMIAVIEKGAEIGAHSLSGAVMNPVALRELLPDFEAMGAPLECPVAKDEVYFLTEGRKSKFPITPPTMHNKGNYIVSLNKLVKWLGELCEAQGVNIFPAFAGTEPLLEGDRLVGVRTGDKGIDAKGKTKSNYEQGIDLRAKVTVLGEGPRGTVTRQVVDRFGLGRGRNPQAYSTGVKEVWELPKGVDKKGLVIHTMGYPLNMDTFGGGFIYFMDKDLVAVGLVIGLDYKDPFLDPHLKLQKFKRHPFVASLLKGGKLAHYGAKVIPEGGYYSIPKLSFDGGLIVGDSAGLVNVPKLKGIHYAIKSGMLAAEAIFEAVKKDDFSAQTLSLYEDTVHKSYIERDLYKVRNFRAAFERGTIPGIMSFALQMATGGLFQPRKKKAEEDWRKMRMVAGYYASRDVKPETEEFKFDGILTFDKLTDVYYSGTSHEEDQPTHLLVADTNICSSRCREEYGNPCQFFCPAKVYEIEKDETTGQVALKINASNCVHCETCDIKDPYDIIRWVPPEGGGGPIYTNL